MRKLLVPALVGAAFVLAAAANPAAAQDMGCPDPSASPIGNVMGNLTVTGACTLNSTVFGDVYLMDGASFTLPAGSKVLGSVKANGAGAVELIGGTVYGDVQIKGSTGETKICGVHVMGDLQAEENTGATAIGHVEGCPGNVVDGDLQAFKNEGDLTIVGNTIYGDFQCVENGTETVSGNIFGAALPTPNPGANNSCQP